MAQDNPSNAIIKEFTANGITTLATAGKYCDKNIELNVNVPIPSGYIKPSGSKTITENGTHDVTNYTSAVVNVPVKPTQFTNVLAYADSLEINTRFASNGTYNTTQPNSMIAVTLDLNKLPGGHPLKNNTNEFRFRGCSHVDSTFAQSEDGSTYSGKSLGVEVKRVDEYGDAVFQRGYIDGRYVRFNIGMAVYPTSSNPVLAADFDPVAAGCIVTFNEPIGNGGYTG